MLRYIEANAARAGLAARAEDWSWSSARERITGERQLLARLPAQLPPNWYELLNADTPVLLVRTDTTSPRTSSR